VAAVEAAGGHVAHYLPDHTLLVVGPARAAVALEQHPHALWLVSRGAQRRCVCVGGGQERGLWCRKGRNATCRMTLRLLAAMCRGCNAAVPAWLLASAGPVLEARDVPWLIAEG
jgi:hypothetical protein